MPTAERAGDEHKADLFPMYFDGRVQCKGKSAGMLAICACARAFGSLAKETDEKLFTLAV